MDREAAAVVDELEDGDADCHDRCAGRQRGQCFLRAYLSHPGVYVLAGVNAPMLLAMVPMLESAMDTQG